MALSVEDLAACCGATRAGGEPGRRVDAANNLREAGPHEAAPLSDPRFVKHLETTRAAAVVVAKGLTDRRPPPSTALLVVEDHEAAWLKVLEALHPPRREPSGVDPRACVEPGVTLGRDVYVGPFAVLRAGASVGDGCQIHAGAYIGPGCALGRDCVLHPYAVLYAGVRLGDEVLVHSGVVLGADGFGYKFREGRLVKVPQVGRLEVAARVEIGANSAVDRAALGATRLGEGAKLDNLVQIGHNTQIGRHVVVCGQAGIAGSCEIQDYAVLGAHAGVADHVVVGAAARVGAKAGLISDIPPKSEVFGYPALPRRTAWRQAAALQKLPDLLKRMKQLERRIEELEGGGKA
ncbi:MAG: UDP-3-O-(3-hydroxymyristoyl)glucosamine N-acyltransferase [Planctomycetota bacterium]|nr:UDP-3-O-(3-hydroxymyristoyl)glucosamine N-acyltransferase [Planctomycetota bacterium]